VDIGGILSQADAFRSICLVTPPPLAAKQATSVIPIVFATAGDPVGSGIVASLARPGGNITGLSSEAPDAAGKKLELLRELEQRI
jgi:ABC-type uncharacterized transport system substrate-binding protein